MEGFHFPRSDTNRECEGDKGKGIGRRNSFVHSFN